MPWRDKRGFTLLEAVVAVTVVGLVGVSALGAIGAELHTASRARATLTAAALAEYRLAGLALLSERELRLLPDSLARGRFTARFDDYAWEASTRRDPALAELVDVTVQVTWADGAYAVSTRLYRPPRQLAVP